MKVKIRLVNSILIAILVCKLLSPERGQLSGLTFGVFLKASGSVACLKKKKKVISVLLEDRWCRDVDSTAVRSHKTHCKCNWC